MPNNSTTQEIEAEELIETLKKRRDSASTFRACTPEAHNEVVETSKDMIRGQIWQIRHANDSANAVMAAMQQALIVKNRGDDKEKHADDVHIKLWPPSITGIRREQVGGVLWKLIVLALFLIIILHQMGLNVDVKKLIGEPAAPVAAKVKQ